MGENADQRLHSDAAIFRFLIKAVYFGYNSTE